MPRNQNEQVFQTSSFSTQSVPSNQPESNEKKGKLYELALFMYVLTRKHKMDFDIGKEVKMADKFDDLVIRLNDTGYKKYTFLQAKLVDNPEQNINIDVLQGKKAISLHKDDFNLRKYFISYLRIKDQLESRNDKSVLTKLIIFTNASPTSSFQRIARDIQIKENVYTIIPQTQKDAKCYKLKLTSKPLKKEFKELKEHLKKDLKSDLEILSKELARYINNKSKDTMVLDKEYLNYYHTALFDEKIIQIQKIQGNKIIGQFTQEFVKNNDTLSPRAKKLRKLIVSNMTEENQKKVIEVLGKAELPISNDFGAKKIESTEIYLPTYDITEKSITDFFDLLEFRVNECDVKNLFESITYTWIKKTFLLYYDTDPAYVCSIVRRFIEKWKNSGGSTTEGWILNSRRKEFIERLITRISKPKAYHKTYEYIEDLHKIVETFGIEFVNSCSFKEESFPDQVNVFSIETNSTLLSSIKIMAYLKKKNSKDYIFLNLESLIKKEEVCELILPFKDDQFKMLILSYDSSLDNDLQQKLFGSLSKMVRSNQKKIVLITSAIDDGLIGKFKESESHEKQKKCKTIDDKSITLRHLKNRSSILKQEIIFQGQPIPLNKLIIQNEDSAKLIDSKTLDKVIRNRTKEIKISSRPLWISNLEGAYAELFQDVNEKTLKENLFDHSPETSEFVYIISGIYKSDQKSSKERLLKVLNLVKISKPKKNIIFDQTSILTLPYQESNLKRIHLVDDQFKEEDFKQLCYDHSDKKVYWIRWNESKFKLQTIYNPDFYLERKFKKVVIRNELNSTFEKKQKLTQGTKNKFVFSGISNNLDDIVKLLNLSSGQLDKSRIFIIEGEDKAKEKFYELDGIVHWLKVENKVEKNESNKQIIWCDSKGSLDCLSYLSNYVDENQCMNLGNETVLIDSIKDKQAVIIADDPGMGKSTTLVKLYQSKYGRENTSKLVDSHWVINVNLRGHLLAIRNIDTKNVNIPKFLSEVDKNLKNDLAQNLLKLALDPKKALHKPLLIAFDGFDEVIDKPDREKVIKLFEDLKTKINAKFWVTTRLQHKQLLEERLSTFSVSFKPLDEQEQKHFVKRFFRDRIRLFLNGAHFKEIFGDSDEVEDNTRMGRYIDKFLEKMQLTFKKDISKFIGTPLQLDLLLGSKSSIEEFKKWAESSPDSIPNFDYLGKNMLEIYKNFINKKFETYFKKEGITQKMIKHVYKRTFISYSKILSKLLLSIDQTKCKRQLEKKKEQIIELSAGLINPAAENLAFIHQTFGEYFASKVCMDWIKEESDLPNQNEQEFLLTNILMKHKYEVIRSFINDGLGKKIPVLPEKTLKEYGKIIKKWWSPKSNSIKEFNTTIYVNFTPLHIAAEESNLNISEFLCNSLGKQIDTWNYLLNDPTGGYLGLNPLLTAARYGTIEMVQWLIKKGADINCKAKIGGELLIHLAAINGNLDLVKWLIEKEYSNIEDKCKGNRTVLHVAAASENWEIVKWLIESKGANINAPRDDGRTILHVAALDGNLEKIQWLIEKGSKINFEPNNEVTLLHDGVFSGNLEVVSFLVNYAKSLNDNEDTFRKLVLSIDSHGQTLLHIACGEGAGFIDIVEELLVYVKEAKEDFKEFAQKRDKCGCTVLHLASMWGYDKVVENLLELFKSSSELLRKFIKITDNDGNTALHEAVYGNYGVFKTLLSYAKNINDNWETFKELVEVTNNSGETAFSRVRIEVQIKEVMKEFLDQANKEKAPSEIVKLLENLN